MLSVVLMLAAAAATSDTTPAADTVRLPTPFVAAVRIPQDTTRRRARAVEVSEWYHRRLVIHRIMAYSVVPVFATQYIAGKKLYDSDNGGPRAPSWAKGVHKLGASAVSGI